MYPEWMTNTLGSMGAPPGTGGPTLGQLGQGPGGDPFAARFGQWQPTMSASGVLPATQPDPAMFGPPGTGGSMLGPAGGPGVPYINQSRVPQGARTNPADLQRPAQGSMFADFLANFRLPQRRPQAPAEPFRFAAPRPGLPPIGRQRGVMSRQGYA